MTTRPRMNIHENEYQESDYQDRGYIEKENLENPPPENPTYDGGTLYKNSSESPMKESIYQEPNFQNDRKIPGVMV